VPAERAYNEAVELFKRLNEVGFERSRRALAALALSLFVFLYLLVSLNPPGEGWRLAFLALSACYGVAFMGVAAEWFWGRWFASGLGWSGVMVAVASLVMLGWTPVLAIYGGVHGLVVLALAGKKMAERFDLQTAWRERYGMDEFGVDRLRKTVTRASASLPSVILWALAPKEPGQGMIVAGAIALASVLAVGGLGGVIRLRSWGVLALAASGALYLLGDTNHISCLHFLHGLPRAVRFPAAAELFVFHLSPRLTALMLATAVVPFAGPIAGHLTRRRNA
jgi:hypothetical protein